MTTPWLGCSATPDRGREYVLQMHGFFADPESKLIRFDVIVDYAAPDAEAVRDDIVKDLRALYPDHQIEVTLDKDISD